MTDDGVGVDKSLINGSVTQGHNELLEDVDRAASEGDSWQSTLLPQSWHQALQALPQTIDCCNHLPGRTATPSSLGPEASPTYVFPATSSSRTSRRRRRRAQSAHPRNMTGPSFTSCEICDADSDIIYKPRFTGDAANQKNNHRRHKRLQHTSERDQLYRCLILNAKGLPCQMSIGPAQNRRRHIEHSHPEQAMQLPPTNSAFRRPNPDANAKLDHWFEKECG